MEKPHPYKGREKTYAHDYYLHHRGATKGGRRAEVPLIGHPPLDQAQEIRLTGLERCCDSWQEETGHLACAQCPKLTGCRKGWDVICVASPIREAETEKVEGL